MAHRGATRGWSGSTCFEDITHPTDGVNQLDRKRVVDLPAQSPDGHVNDVAVAFEVHVPDVLGNDQPRKYLALAASQQGQKGKLFGSQIEPRFPPMGFRAEEVNSQVGDLHDVGGAVT